MICPFCEEDDFDDMGLKNHLVSGHCATFNDIPRLRPSTVRDSGQPQQEKSDD